MPARSPPGDQRYRVVLTHNLLLAGNQAVIVPDDVDDLTACLVDHFAEHYRLVYLPDRDYTPRGQLGPAQRR